VSFSKHFSERNVSKSSLYLFIGVVFLIFVLVKTAGVIWSYFILAAYAVVFGYQIIPHHHHDLNAYHNHHSSGLMDHCVTEKETHQHIAHDQHFDEGIWDYIGCLIGHQEHQPLEGCRLEQVIDKRLSDTQHDKNVDFIVLKPILSSCQVENSSTCTFQNGPYFLGSSATISLRGPPLSIA